MVVELLAERLPSQRPQFKTVFQYFQSVKPLAIFDFDFLT